MNDITLGQFFPGNSVLHKIDPRMKIILTAVFIVAVFMAGSLLALGVLTIVAFLLPIIAKISPKVVIKSLKPLRFILVFMAIINVFWTKGEGDPLLSFWVINVYTEGLLYALFVIVRIVVLLVGTTVLLSYTTSPIALTDSIEQLLAPLKKIRVPVHDFAMMMTIALRFIPTLIDETNKIMSAQKARGVNFSEGGLLKRAKALIPIFIPLFVSSIRRADELAVAMECRCYRGDKGRTRMKVLRYGMRDFVALFLAVGLTVGIFFVSKLAFGVIV